MEFQALPFAEPATGLIYARARWYDPQTGTFLSPDPLGYADSSNLYSFAGGDPVNGRDPRGESNGKKIVGLLFPILDPERRAEMSAQLHKAADAIDAVAEEALAGTDDSQWFTKSAAQTMQLASGFLRTGTQSGVELGEGTSGWQVVQNRVYEGMPMEEARALAQDWDYLSDADKARLISMGISKTASLIAGARGFQQTIYRPATVPAIPRPRTPGATPDIEAVPRPEPPGIAQPRRAGTTRQGVTRNNPSGWRALRDLWDEMGYEGILSEANRGLIAKGRTPIVDDAWAKHFPGDAPLMGEQIPLHHIDGGKISVPLPKSRHIDALRPGGFRRNPGGPGTSG